MNVVLKALQTRVSHPMRCLKKATPTQDEWNEIFKAVASAPDYGSLLPYKFYVLQGEKLDAHIAIMKQNRLKAYPEYAENIKIKMTKMAQNVGAIVIATHTHNTQATQSEHDQLCATICASSHMYLALNALEYGAVWITPDPAGRNKTATDLNFADGEFITGIFMIGGISQTPKKDRPAPKDFVTFI